MSSTFEHEYGATGKALGMTPTDTRDALKVYRKTAARLSKQFTANETAKTARELASYLLPSSALTDQDAAAVAKVFAAMQAIDKETGGMRNSELAAVTTDEAAFRAAKARAGVSPSFALAVDVVQRLRGLV